MTTSAVDFYRPQIDFDRVVGLSTPNVQAGNQVILSGDVSAATARPLRQRAAIETSVTYSVTMRWRRQVVTISTPELPTVDLTDYFYLRPDGTSQYFRPDGTSRYVRVK